MTTQDKIKVIIERAIDGGYKPDYPDAEFTEWGMRESYAEYQTYRDILCDPDFYKSLGKSCGLDKDGRHPMYFGVHFMEINLTQSFEAGIDYLYNLVEKN